jgi:hypothetical protein
MRFLYSIDERHLDGHGFALSLTVKDAPATSADWHGAWNVFFR